jgi:hypothetical protein
LADLTKQGREKIQGFVEEEVAPSIRDKWRGNLLDSQQSLAQDIQIFTDSSTVQVGSKNEVLKFLEWGVRPHVIEPKDAMALRWFNDEGEAVFAKKVQHPGFEPYAHMRSAISETRRNFKP